MTALEIFSKVIFGSSVILILYIIFYEWKSSQIADEKAEIQLKELENENIINNSSDAAIVDDINKECESGQPGSSNKPK